MVDDVLTWYVTFACAACRSASRSALHGPISTQSSAAARVRKSPATRTNASPGWISSAAVPGAAPCTPISAWACPARSAGG